VEVGNGKIEENGGGEENRRGERCDWQGKGVGNDVK
jgi:hypothetical protein